MRKFVLLLSLAGIVASTGAAMAQPYHHYYHHRHHHHYYGRPR